MRNVMRLPLGQRGFTLLEAMIAVTVVAILFSLAAPAFSTWLENSHFRSDARTLMAHFQQARHEAIKYNSFCSLTFDTTIDGTHYDYIAYLDTNRDLQYTAGERLVAAVKFQASSFNPDNDKSDADGVTFGDNPAGDPSFAWNSRGYPVLQNGGFAPGTVFLKSRQNQTQEVILSKFGRVRTE